MPGTGGTGGIELAWVGHFGSVMRGSGAGGARGPDTHTH
jgi:hypothetical protein